MNTAGPASQAPDANRLAVLLGPTAVGKTATAIAVARHIGAEIISADSRCLYVGMDIGTAKPTAAERAAVPHHLIDVTTPDQPWSLAQYQAAAQSAIGEIIGRGRLPLLVGGTGQYIRAITEGWLLPPGEPGSALRHELEAALARDGLEALVLRLWAEDPAAAAQVDLRNPRRVLRALEVALGTGQSFVDARRRAEPPYAVIQFGLSMPRPDLYARIDARVDFMLTAGWVEEVAKLAARGYSWDLPAMSALGYRQIGQHLRGELTLADAAADIKRATRQFVRRQANWFKAADPGIRWVAAGDGAAEQIARSLQAPRGA